MLEGNDPAVAETADPTAPAAESADPTAAPAPTAEPTGESAPPDTKPGDDPAAESTPKEKKGGDFQKRINEITRDKYQEKMRADAAERELAELRKKLQPERGADPGQKPKLTDFSTVEEWEKAMEDWAVRKGEQNGYTRATEERESSQRDQQVREQTAALKAREDAAAEKYSDYWQATAPISEVVMGNPVLRQYMIESDHSPEVGYHLAKNPAVLEQLLQMSPWNAARELMNLEAKITAPPPPKATTSAPNPVPPVGGREPARKSLADLAEKDTDAYIRKRNQQELKRRSTG